MPEGKKFDTGKRRMDLLSITALQGTADILTFGADKYGDRNWENGIAYSRVYGALLRHLTSWWAGEDLDPESGKPHLDHVGCCVMFLQEFIHKRPEYDDRPK